MLSYKAKIHNIIDRLEKIDVSQPGAKTFLIINAIAYEVVSIFRNLATGQDYVFDLKNSDGDVYCAIVRGLEYDFHIVDADGNVEWWQKPISQGATENIGYEVKINGEREKIY